MSGQRCGQCASDEVRVFFPTPCSSATHARLAFRMLTYHMMRVRQSRSMHLKARRDGRLATRRPATRRGGRLLTRRPKATTKRTPPPAKLDVASRDGDDEAAGDDDAAGDKAAGDKADGDEAAGDDNMAAASDFQYLYQSTIYPSINLSINSSINLSVILSLSLSLDLSRSLSLSLSLSLSRSLSRSLSLSLSLSRSLIAIDLIIVCCSAARAPPDVHAVLCLLCAMY